MKHTKGPWKVETGGNFIRVAPVCEIYHDQYDHEAKTNHEGQANANLIAAAPEMLEALELILSDNRLMNAMNIVQSSSVLDAITKARGE